ncbi:MAG: CRISPR-associated helicase Cas3' [Candidatus Heimdallarchaeota archaeon]|nr:CRISPR-associated helicase Cas3' [Candidatus Heimdallarchaeota archaeon]
MSYSFKLKSHENKLLIDHLRETGEYAEKFASSVKCLSGLEKYAYIAGITHDFGKATTYFQDYLEIKKRSGQLTNHAFLSSLLAFYLSKEYYKENSDTGPLLSWLSVKRHHGGLKDINDEFYYLGSENRSELIDTVLEQLSNIRQNNEIIYIYSDLLPGCEQLVEKFIDFEKNELNDLSEYLYSLRKKHEISFPLFSSFYSVLLDTDKLSTTGGMPSRSNLPHVDSLIRWKNEKVTRASNLNSYREAAFTAVVKNTDSLNLTNRILSITLPTGMGKTITSLGAGLKLAKRLKEERGIGKVRIIYCLPFLSIIEQNSEVIYDFLRSWICGPVSNEMFLEHHHLSDRRYTKYTKRSKGKALEYLNPNYGRILAEAWHSEIIITTFVQLFRTLCSGDHHAIQRYHNLSNSIIILDEVQSIPSKFWPIVRTSLKDVAERLDSYIIFVTATQPGILQDTIEVVPPTCSPEALNRYDISSFGEIDETKLIENFMGVLSKYRFKKSGFMVVNTISAAVSLYSKLKEKLRSEFGRESRLDENGIIHFDEIALAYLSSKVLPDERSERIKILQERRREKLPTILLSTQVIEAGVDISSDILFRDMAPLDSIMQAAGRCNRHSECPQGGSVFLFDLVGDSGKHTRSIYDSVLISLTKRMIEGKAIDEIFLRKQAPEYFKEVNEITAESTETLQNYSKLEFEKLNEFSLIEKIRAEIPILVERTPKAKNTVEKIMEIVSSDMNKFKRRNTLLSIRREIAKITLNMPLYEGVKPTLPKIDNTSFYYVPYDELDEWYDLETGLRAKHRKWIL